MIVSEPNCRQGCEQVVCHYDCDLTRSLSVQAIIVDKVLRREVLGVFNFIIVDVIDEILAHLTNDVEDHSNNIADIHDHDREVQGLQGVSDK